MNDNQFQQWLKLQERQVAALEKIAIALDRLAPEKPAPNYKQSLKNFPTFDWSSIDAEVEKMDRYGAAIVIWNNQRYVRRSPENSYGAAIFFTRCVGKDETGKNKYERLITFEPIQELKVRPISRDAESMIQ
ncbi:hypothetical protein C7H19_19295 [Aphanothece hegewaldii CCALA 016]|uniref:Uncharacterized protein n=1 Tax=Aphanothece hegewaldii CCALA 016 TaxID=2107694 RepID=A0A2T1LT99_9CHRO|nr:single-stranded DNA-binding protein [Aphanothece hegewaldii]PSF33871.1 hypothetical protein C7H19_19295 [Aphanothece hegewaldii CCALA 016]